MYIRKLREIKSGKTYHSFQLVESVRIDGKPRQRNILNLGAGQLRLKRGVRTFAAGEVDRPLSRKDFRKLEAKVADMIEVGKRAGLSPAELAQFISTGWKEVNHVQGHWKHIRAAHRRFLSPPGSSWNGRKGLCSDWASFDGFFTLLIKALSPTIIGFQPLLLLSVGYLSCSFHPW